MSVVLLCGIPTESPLQLVIEAAERRGNETVLFNQREAQHIDMQLGVDAGRLIATLYVCGTTYDLNSISGVYVRLMDHSRLPENCASRAECASEAIVKSYWLHQTFAEWLELTSCRVMNRARDMASNVSKPYQAQLIRRSGFSIPPTLVTNDPVAVAAFRRANRRIIYKSTSSIRSIVRELTDDDLARVRNLPTQFQAYIEGTNIRVHVTGQKLFATEIQSEAIDYRYAARDNLDVDMVPIELPEEIQRRCFELSHRLCLPLCGIDLKRTPEGEYVCFEVNPSPAFSYYQSITGQPIADSILDYLVS